MQTEIQFAGFGGQGILLSAKLMAQAAMNQGYFVAWVPSYGPEMRGGTAFCCVVISNKPVGSPLVTDDACCAMVMNLPSMLKFEPRVTPGGRLLVNSSLIDIPASRDDLEVFYIPAVEEATACGNGKMANMVMLGAYLELTGIIKPQSVLDAFHKVFGSKAKKLLAANRTALERGAEVLHSQAFVPAAA